MARFPCPLDPISRATPYQVTKVTIKNKPISAQLPIIQQALAFASERLVRMCLSHKSDTKYRKRFAGAFTVKQRAISHGTGAHSRKGRVYPTVSKTAAANVLTAGSINLGDHASSFAPALLPDSGIRNGVENIGEEVYGYVGEANCEDATLDQVVIAVGDGLDGEASDAGPGEDGFGDDCAG